MPEAYICNGVRTPIGRYGGGLAPVRADDLAAIPILSLITRNPGLDAETIDDVILGCANQAGAELVHGQSGPNDDGYYVRPTLVLNPNSELSLTRDEVFGPVLALTRVADAEEGLTKANDSVYGLLASLWTRDLKAALDFRSADRGRDGVGQQPCID